MEKENINALAVSVSPDAINFIKFFNETVRSELEILKPEPKIVKHHSDQLNELFAAIANAKKKIGTIHINQENPFFKSGYADQFAINDAITIPLAEEGLTILQPTYIDDNGEMMLRTIVCHSSGQWIDSEVRLIPTKDDFQGFGSASTYMRRYQVTSLLSLAIKDDTLDDDAEYAQAEHRNAKIKGTAETFKKRSTVEVISPDELEVLQDELEGYPELASTILNKYKLHCLADLPKSEFKVVKSKIGPWKNSWDSRGKPTV